jgi:hypothetical protein
VTVKKGRTPRFVCSPQARSLKARVVAVRKAHVMEHSMNVDASAPGVPGNAADFGAAAIARGVARLLRHLEYAVLAECPLANGRRADLLALHRDGSVALVEIKASVADFRADAKWPEYVPYCDRFFFAVAPGFPVDVLPAEPGIIVADAWSGAMLRVAALMPLKAARRRALTLRFARTAAARLERLQDPFGAVAPGG